MAVVFYGCISLDGYLAGKDHDLTWLYESGTATETSYPHFYPSVDVAIMGRNTFNEVNKAMVFSEAYPTTKNYLFTHHQDIDVEGIEIVSGDVVDFVKNIDQSKKVWIVGGSGLVSSILQADMFDQLIIQIAPVILGGGIRLFQESDEMKRFKLTEVKQYGPFAELIYDKITP